MASDRFGRDDLIAGLDDEVGTDGDQPGISQPVTQDELDDILNDPNLPLEERRAMLEAIASRIEAREAGDRGDEFAPLRQQIGSALTMLAEGGHIYGEAESVGLDPEYRSDARAPDDDANENL